MTPSNTPKPKITKVEVDRQLCIGAATCVSLAINTFELDAENKSVPKTKDGVIPDGHVDDAETIMAAAEGCPVKAIKVFDAEGRQIYPAS